MQERILSTQEPEDHHLTGQPAIPITRDSHGGWLPGVSGNPKGRPPKGQSFAELARNLPNEVKQKVIDQMVKQAADKGKVQAAEFLRDTAEGKPRQTVQVEAGIGDDWRQEMLASLLASRQLPAGDIIDGELVDS